jgi:phage baseplate assembly protein V
MTARSEGIEDLALPDMERRVANMVRLGKVSAVDLANARVRIKSGDIETAWLPWSTGRAHPAKRRWDPPAVGEQVVMLSPTGDLRQAVVMPGVFQDNAAAPSSSGDKDATVYSDGTVIEYDRAAHALTADLQGTKLFADRNKIELTIGGTVLTLTAGGTTLTTPQLTVDAAQSTFTGAVNVQGLLTYAGGLTGSGGSGASMQGSLLVNGSVAVTSGSVTHNGTNIGDSHVHSGILPGGGNTAGPQ